MSDNRKVLIFGGSRGIGAALVRAFVSRDTTVMFTYSGSRALALEVAERTGAKAIRADAADRSEVVAIVRQAGPLDVFIYNAGIFVKGEPLTISPDDVDHLFDVNVRAPYHATVEAARTMRHDGRVLLIGSVHGDRMPFQGITAYGASKSALQGMARGFARDFGDRRITVNVIQPGPTDTDMNPALGPQAGEMHSQMAIKRHGTPEEVANLAVYLAGPHSGGITGAIHTIDGGFGA